MAMVGAHAMSMAWAPGAEGGWLRAAATFVVMWTAMMGIMMLPSLVPMLQRYRRAMVEVRGSHAAPRIALVAAGYLGVWGVIGAAVFAVQGGLTMAGARWPSLAAMVPLATGLVVVVAGVHQFTRWKARHLACCRAPADVRRLDGRLAAAWRHGVGLGAHCVADSAGLTAALLAIGMMDLRAVAAVTAAITAERLAPAGERVARWVGGIAVGGGLVLIARAVGPS